MTELTVRPATLEDADTVAEVVADAFVHDPSVVAMLGRGRDVHSVLAALRKWRNENPSKRPNPGHIVQMLKDAWGRKHADQTRAALAPPVEPQKERISDERRRAILAEADLRDPFAVKTIAGITPSENL